MRFSKIKLTAERANHAQHSMTHSSNWRLGILASAVALLGSLSHAPSMALGLGKVTVQSALGEALRAEVDVPEINAEEAASLRVSVAAPAAFRAAGLEYSPAVTELLISLQKRPDGRSYLRLTSSRPVTEPFVDLIIEASWASGRLVRDYTMLFDPPNLRQQAQTAPTSPTTAAARPTASGIAQAPLAIQPRPQAASGARAASEAQMATPKPVKPLAREKTTTPPKPAATGQQVTVKAGDTASKIAAQNKPANISLDQMLVALLKSNPEAFVGSNINRLRAGAVLDIPSSDDAALVTSADASRTVVAQAKDFNDFRQKLASGAPMTQVESANRQTGGKVQAKVDDRAPASVAPDKLTLSKGALKGKATEEENIAKDKQAKDAASRVAELSKNIGDLNKIATAPTAAAAGAASSAAKAPGLPVDKPVAVAVPAPVATPALPAPAVATPTVSATATLPAQKIAATATATATATMSAASGAAAPAASAPALAPAVMTSPASAPAASAPAASNTVASAPVVVKKPAVPAPQPPETGFIDDLTNNEFVLPGLAALLALLAGFGFYRYKKRDQGSSVDSSFLESRLQPDSFFGASGGQRIDTNESGSATGSSMVYSPSQLDAAGDVDPVAEADVYLAYGRDLQAEEILKEALRTHPTRVAIHAKLLEIYAKRRDLKGFEFVAGEAFNLTNGTGSEWGFICELGRDVDPTNPLYQQGGQPQVMVPLADRQTPAMAASFGSDTIPVMTTPSLPSGGAAPDVDFDLDLDFSDGNTAPQATPGGMSPALAPTLSMPAPEPTVAMRAIPEPSFEGLEMDFGGSKDGHPNASQAVDNPMSFELDLPTVAANAVASAAKPAPPTQAAPAMFDSGMLEFDMGSLSLDLEAPITESPTLSKAAVSAPQAVGPLETKFALAEEFRALGDSDGARSLASEVVAQAQGSLKTKAQAFLNALS